jgi:hypothetical protein
MARRSRRQKFQGKCEWCGDNFRFFSPVTESCTPRRLVRYCSKKCIAEENGYNRRKLPGAAILRELYEMQQMSGPAIARLYGCGHTSVYKALKRYGIPQRPGSGARTCRQPGCGQPACKYFTWQSQKGAKVLHGAWCAKHRKERSCKWAYARARKLDPLYGTRKTGRKAKPMRCSKCGELRESARAAVACHNQRWSKIKAFNQASV